MKKNLKRALVVLLACGLFFVSCDTGSNPDTKEPNAALATPVLTVVSGVETVTVSWAAVPNATKYTLYYTKDGSVPVTTATGSFNVEVTGLSKEIITGYTDSDKTYRFILVAEAPKYDTAKSAVTAGNKPIIKITITAKFGDTYKNTKVGGKFLTMDWTGAVGEKPTNVELLEYVALTTDENGSAIFTTGQSVPGKYYGCAFFIDMDEDGKMSTGDTVAGPGNPGEYSYSWWDSKDDTKSWTATIDWNVNYKNHHIF